MATKVLNTAMLHHKVHTEDDGRVDQEEVMISRRAQEQVTWFSAKGALVAFTSPDGSPFHDAKFQIPAGGSVSSGPVRPDAEEKKYKYVVVGKTGVNDPKVIIKP